MIKEISKDICSVQMILYDEHRHIAKNKPALISKYNGQRKYYK